MAGMSPPRVLLVDDHREVSNMLRSSIQLSGLDCVVVDVTTGEDAIQEMGRGPVDLLVADVRLPGISGLDLIERLEQIYPQARTILITGEPSAEVRRRAEALGVVALLEKPIGTSLFLEAVARVLRDVRRPAVSRDLAGENRARLLARLQVLHATLEATSVQLIDSFGRIVDQEGQILGGDTELVHSALAAASDAGQKVSELISGLLPANVQVFEGGKRTCTCSTWGLSTISSLRSTVRRGWPRRDRSWLKAGGQRTNCWSSSLVLARLRWPGRSELSSNSGVKQPQAKWRVIMDGDEGEVKKDLEQAGKGIKREAADEFWDQAASSPSNKKEGEDGILTYEEARNQGLLEEDE